MEDEYESVEFLRVGTMNHVVDHEHQGHAPQDIQHVLLGVIEGKHKDEGTLIDEVNGRIVLLHQHGENESAREASIQYDCTQKSRYDGNCNNGTQ